MRNGTSNGCNGGLSLRKKVSAIVEVGNRGLNAWNCDTQTIARFSNLRATQLQVLVGEYWRKTVKKCQSWKGHCGNGQIIWAVCDIFRAFFNADFCNRNRCSVRKLEPCLWTLFFLFNEGFIFEMNFQTIVSRNYFREHQDVTTIRWFLL